MIRVSDETKNKKCEENIKLSHLNNNKLKSSQGDKKSKLNWIKDTECQKTKTKSKHKRTFKIEQV